MNGHIMFTIVQHNSPSGGSFDAMSEDRQNAGVMTYSWRTQDRIVIEHTEVMPAFRGQNLANQLVHKAVEWARSNRLKITPVCQFAAKILRTTPAYQDVL